LDTKSARSFLRDIKIGIVNFLLFIKSDTNR
jgi:hypothetical protein